MLSRFRLSWKVILENHFPSLAGGFFCVRTSKPCALYSQPPLLFFPRHPFPISGRLGFIKSEVSIASSGAFLRGQRMGLGLRGMHS